MDRNRFIQCMKSNIELSDKERRRIIRRSVESQPWKLKCTIAMEEFAELTQAISKQIRGYDNKGLEVGEMKICKVRPDYSTCSACVATQEMFNVVDDCSKCKLNTDTYELLQIGTGFWSGDYAMVQKDGKITKVSLNRVYDVKESL